MPLLLSFAMLSAEACARLSGQPLTTRLFLTATTPRTPDAISAALGQAPQTLEELNRTVIRQQQQIDQPQQELRALRQQVQTGNAAESYGPHDETPPRY